MSPLRAELFPHPATPCPAIRRLGVTVDSTVLPQELGIRFRVEGRMPQLRIPAPGFARRSDGLWQHTCFEAFLKADAGDGYYEFNFAPSGDWAAYRFGGRRRNRESPDIPYPPFAIERSREHCELIAFLPIAALPGLDDARSIRAGLAVVVEADDGVLSYWSLAHGGARPDFHDPASFQMTVSPP